jgi:hypothetical protein
MPIISEYPFEIDPSKRHISEERAIGKDQTATLHKATFMPVILQIESKKDRFALGFTFDRGPLDGSYNAIWGLEEKWDNKTNSFGLAKWVVDAKASGDDNRNPFSWDAGDIVEVKLQRDDYVKKTDGQIKAKYVIVGAKRLPPDTPVDDPWLKAPGEKGEDSTPKAPTVSAPRGNSGDLDARILKNSAWNNLTAMLAAEQLESHKFYRLWEEQLHHAMQGEPLFQDDDVEFQLYKNKVISPPEVPQEQTAMDFDAPPLDYQLESKALMKEYFGEDGASDAAVWLSENVGSVNDSENEKSYWFKVYAMLKKEFGG